MRTTLDLPDSLFQKAKQLARRRHVSFRVLVTEALRRLMDDEPKKTRFVLPNRSFRGDGLREGLTEADWDKIRDLSYEGRGA